MPPRRKRQDKMMEPARLTAPGSPLAAWPPSQATGTPKQNREAERRERERKRRKRQDDQWGGGGPHLA